MKKTLKGRAILDLGSSRLFSTSLKLGFIISIGFLLNACDKREVPNYHLANQPLINTDNFIEDRDGRNFNIYGETNFYNNKRQWFSKPKVNELIFRRLRGTIKKLEIQEHTSDNRIFNYVFSFDEKGQVIAENERNAELIKDEVRQKLDQKLKEGNDPHKKMVISMDLDHFEFKDGKLYEWSFTGAGSSGLETHIRHKYSYHSNGKKATKESPREHEMEYYGKNGLIDSVAPTNINEINFGTVKRYHYTGHLITKYENLLYDYFGEGKPRQLNKAYVDYVTYKDSTDLPVRVRSIQTGADSTKVAIETLESYTYSEDNDLLKYEEKTIYHNEERTTDHIEKYQYEYDDRGNYTQIKSVHYSANQPDKKSIDMWTLIYTYR